VVGIPVERVNALLPQAPEAIGARFSAPRGAETRGGNSVDDGSGWLRDW